MMKFVTISLFTSAIFLTGCATPKYSCGVPDGIGCRPLSEVHQMALDGTLKSQVVPDNRDSVELDQDEDDFDDADTQQPPAATTPRSAGLATVIPNAPLLIPPQTMRVWVAPWPDEGGTLHDETYLYLRLDSGHWVMEQP